MGVGGDSQSQEASEMIGREGVHLPPFAADQPLTEASSAEYRERRGDVPRIGTAFPVVMRQFDMQEEDLPARGQWIRLRKLSSWVRDGQLQGLFGQPSRWAQAEPNESWRAAYEKRLETRRTSMWAPDVLLAGAGGDIQSQDDLPADPENPPLTMTPHQGRAAAYPPRDSRPPPPSRHRCLVRVVGHFPKDVHDFCADGSAGGLVLGTRLPRGNAEAAEARRGADADVAFVSAKTDDSEHEFEVSLLLEDATGKLRAHLSPREARTFFHGIQPCDLWESEVSYARVADKMRKLTAHHTAAQAGMDRMLHHVVRRAGDGGGGAGEAVLSDFRHELRGVRRDEGRRGLNVAEETARRPGRAERRRADSNPRAVTRDRDVSTRARFR